MRRCWQLRNPSEKNHLFVAMKPFRFVQTIAGLWDVGQGGDSGPGSKGRRPDKVAMTAADSQSVQQAPGTPAGGGHRPPGAARGPARTRRTTSEITSQDRPLAEQDISAAISGTTAMKSSVLP